MTEQLNVPEEHLLEVIAIIRRGLRASRKVTPVVREQLTKWCDEEEQYMGQS